MKKKLLALVLVVVLAVTAVVGGTMAYLTDTEAAVNVMTVGNVSIRQNEQQRVIGADGLQTDVLEDYEQGKVLMPYTTRDPKPDDNTLTVGEYTFNRNRMYNNYVDKIVSVTNTGKSDAYVRTLIAIPTGGSAWEQTPVAAADVWLHWNTISTMNTYWDSYYTDSTNYAAVFVEIDGQGYYVWEFTHKAGLVTNETTFPTLLGCFMDYRVDSDDEGYFMDMNSNHKCDADEKRIEDVEVGGTVEILVLSQAVQTDGFASAQSALDTAFGDVTAENAAKWFGDLSAPTPVSTADELAAALAAGNDVYLTADITDTRMFVVAENADVVMYMNGHTLTSMDGGSGANYAIKVSKGASLTLKGDGKIVASCYGVSVSEDATFTMNSGEIVVRGNGTYDFGVVVWNGAKFVMNGGKITASVDVYASFYNGYNSTEQPAVVINNGELIKEKETNDLYDPAYIMTDCTPDVTINGGTFDGTAFSGNVSDYVVTDENT